MADICCDACKCKPVCVVSSGSPACNKSFTPTLRDSVATESEKQEEERICNTCDSSHICEGEEPAPCWKWYSRRKAREERKAEKQEVPEEKTDTVGVLCLAGLELIVRDLAGRVEKLEQAVPEVETCHNCDKPCKLYGNGSCTKWEPKLDTVKQAPTGVLRTVSNPLCQTCVNMCKLNKFECTEYQVKSDQELCMECTRTCKNANMCKGFTVSPDPKPESEVKLMDFSEALKLLKMGNKVRRVVWKKGNNIFIDNDILLTGYADTIKHFVWKPDHADLLATDWMLHIE